MNTAQPRPRRLLGVLSGLFAALLVLAAAPGAAPAAHAQSKPFHWAADSSADVPYTFHDLKDQNKLTGFEYDLMQELSRHMARRWTSSTTTGTGLFPACNVACTTWSSAGSR